MNTHVKIEEPSDFALMWQSWREKMCYQVKLKKEPK